MPRFVIASRVKIDEAKPRLHHAFQRVIYGCPRWTRAAHRTPHKLPAEVPIGSCRRRDETTCQRSPQRHTSGTRLMTSLMTTGQSVRHRKSIQRAQRDLAHERGSCCCCCCSLAVINFITDDGRGRTEAGAFPPTILYAPTYHVYRQAVNHDKPTPARKASRQQRSRWLIHSSGAVEINRTLITAETPDMIN